MRKESVGEPISDRCPQRNAGRRSRGLDQTKHNRQTTGRRDGVHRLRQPEILYRVIRMNSEDSQKLMPEENIDRVKHVVVRVDEEFLGIVNVQTTRRSIHRYVLL